ncbi:MAG: N utilization substance protein B, partial [Proteobacteria bacterium]|nr:N utilization substance protein B [Pseudomonadota bacterium]
MAAIKILIAPLMQRSTFAVGEVEHAILMLGVYELQHHLETPFRVVLNEAIELAKIFGGEGAHAFINGTLHKASKELRPLEHKLKL